MKTSRYVKLKQAKKTEARKAIAELFLKAKEAFPKSIRMADRSVRKARRLAMKHKIRLPSDLKRQFCKHCYSFLSPGNNCRVRLVNQKVVYYCLSCRKYTRMPYARERKAEKRATQKAL